MAIPFLVPVEENPSGGSRTTATSSNTTTTNAPAAASTSSQPQTPSSSAQTATNNLPPVMQLNSEHLMLAFIEAVDRYYRDTQGGWCRLFIC